MTLHTAYHTVAADAARLTASVSGLMDQVADPGRRESLYHARHMISALSIWAAAWGDHYDDAVETEMDAAEVAHG